MSITLTRHELYEHIWSRPMKHLAAEWDVTAEQLRESCEKADIPRPGYGYWTLMEMGRTTDRTAMGPAPSSHSDPVTIVSRPVRRKAASPVVHSTTNETVGGTLPKEREPSAANSPPPPVPPSAHDATADVGQSAQPEDSLPVGDAAKRPTASTTLTREALYDEVWRTPMYRLAARFGVTGNGLAKICDRAGVPYPTRGYWAKPPASQALEKTPLPTETRASAANVTIRPTPPQVAHVQLSAEVLATAEAVRKSVGELSLPQRLNRPHSVIAGWLREREERRRDARRETSPWTRTSFMPADFNDLDRRKHRLLDALFKALEQHGVNVREDAREGLFAEAHGEKIQFTIREKNKQVRRPLNEDELKYRRPNSQGWTLELKPTGCFVFNIKTHLPSGFTQEWSETDAEPFETLIPNIAAIIVSVAPVLKEQSRLRAEAERQRQIEQARRYQEEQRRKKDANRWRRFMALARCWNDLDLARSFIDALKAAADNPLSDVDRATVADGIAWAEEQLINADPIAQGPARVFRDVGSVNEWSYDEEGRLRPR